MKKLKRKFISIMLAMGILFTPQLALAAQQQTTNNILYVYYDRGAYLMETNINNEGGFVIHLFDAQKEDKKTTYLLSKIFKNKTIVITYEDNNTKCIDDDIMVSFKLK